MENTTGDQLCEERLAQQRERRMKWYLSNRDRVKAKYRDYYSQNKEAIKERFRTPNDCALCGGRYTYVNKYQHLRTHKHALALKHNLEQGQATTDLPLKAKLSFDITFPNDLIWKAYI